MSQWEPCCGAFLRWCPVMVPTGKIMCHGCWNECDRATSAGRGDGLGIPDALWLTEKGWDAVTAPGADPDTYASAFDVPAAP